MPPTIFAFGAGWNCGSLGETPPVLGELLGGDCDGELAPEVSATAIAGSRHAHTSPTTTSSSGLSARFGNVSFVRLPG